MSPRPDYEPAERVLYRCPNCPEAVWDVDTGNRRLCATCGDVMKVAFARLGCEPILPTPAPEAESKPSTPSSLPIARCPECSRPWGK